MHLQGDEAALGHEIIKVRHGNAVDPRLDVLAPGFDAEMVPFVLFEGLLCFRLVFEVEEPSAAGFVVDAAGPGAVGGVDLDLIPVHAAVLEPVEAVAADLYAGIHARIDLELEFEDEIAVMPFGAEEGV